MSTALKLTVSWRAMRAGLNKSMSDAAREKLLYTLLYLEAARPVKREAVLDRLFGTWVRMKNRREKVELAKFAKKSAANARKGR